MYYNVPLLCSLSFSFWGCSRFLSSFFLSFCKVGTLPRVTLRIFPLLFHDFYFVFSITMSQEYLYPCRNFFPQNSAEYSYSTLKSLQVFQFVKKILTQQHDCSGKVSHPKSFYSLICPDWRHALDYSVIYLEQANS